MSLREDKYGSITFDKSNKSYSDSMKRYKSESHREFFESKFQQSPDIKNVEHLVTDTLMKLQGKVKHQIIDGSKNVSDEQSNVNKVSKDLQIELATDEIYNMLEVLRSNHAGTITKVEYDRRKQLITDKIQQLKDEDLQDDLAEELHRFEKETLGEPTKSLIGRESHTIQPENKEAAVELAKQMVVKLHEDKIEHCRLIKERKQKINEK